MIEHQHQGELVAVFVTSGVRTSAGAGPGIRRVPPAEAAQLVARRHAVPGDRAPKGYEDGGADARTIAAAAPRPASPPAQG